MFLILSVSLLGLSSCAPTSGPDKSIAGAVLGAGWGAGAGAVIGHQVGDAGPGAAIGAGFGAASGLLTGMGLDVAEGTELEQQRELDALRVQTSANTRMLMALQDQLDNRGHELKTTSYSAEVFFDRNLASLRAGSAERLQRLAESVKLNPYIGKIEIHGHSDDTGDVERNKKLSDARARTVATFLASQGISFDQLREFAHGSSRPIASNDSEAGRQLNRRVEIVLKK